MDSLATQPLEQMTAGARRVAISLREDGRVRRLVTDAAEVTIGSDPNSDVVIDDPTVSRYHCALELREDAVVLRDLRSTNGTMVEGVAIREAVIAQRATLALGNAHVEVECLDETGEESPPRDDSFGPLVGRSAQMRRLLRVLAQVAPTDATVLLEGETGTGKSMLARQIHALSPRADRLFTVVDCAALPPTLIESELFGHERGAFTGADKARSGAFENAHGGTLFLDEIGELPLDLQAKFLRAIEERRVRRVGSNKDIDVDVRLVAATNRDLRIEVNEKRFRGDLFYRLNVLRLRIPPLRERPADIAALIEHFCRTLSTTDVPFRLAAEDIDRMVAAPWPGNTRELRGVIERAVLLGERPMTPVGPTPNMERPPGGIIEIQPWQRGERFRDAKQRALRVFEAEFVDHVMNLAEGNVSKAARIAKMDRNYLRALLERTREG